MAESRERHQTLTDLAAELRKKADQARAIACMELVYGEFVEARRMSNQAEDYEAQAKAIEEGLK